MKQLRLPLIFSLVLVLMCCTNGKKSSQEVGSNSNAQCILGDYRPNPVNNIQELLDFRDPDKVVSNFLTKFRNEFLNTIPETAFMCKIS